MKSSKYSSIYQFNPNKVFHLLPIATYRKLGNRLKTLQVNLSLALKNPKDRNVKVSVTDSVKLSRWMIAIFFVNTYF